MPSTSFKQVLDGRTHNVCLVLFEQLLVESHVSQNLDACLAESVATDLVAWKTLLLQGENLPALLDKVVAEASPSWSRPNDDNIIIRSINSLQIRKEINK